MSKKVKSKDYGSSLIDDDDVVVVDLGAADEAAGNKARSNTNYTKSTNSKNNDDDMKYSTLSTSNLNPSTANKRPSLLKTSKRTSLKQQRPSLKRSNSSFNQSIRNLRSTLQHSSSQSFRAIKRQSSTIFEGINNNLPTSPSGWALAVLGAASVGLQYELHIQKELTSPPLVYCQKGSGLADSIGGSVLNDKMDRIYDKLSGKKGKRLGQHPNGSKVEEEEEGILTRKISPQLFIGTRGLMSSTAAYALGSIKKYGVQKKVRREREVVTMGADGALIVLDWEIPLTTNLQTTIDNDIDIKQRNSITKPIILLLHGMNNDSTFGYILPQIEDG